MTKIPNSRLVPVEYILECFEYREEVVDGVLQGNVYWKYRDDVPNNWNARYAGKKSGSLDKKKGYYRINLRYDGKLCSIYLHIIVWILNKKYYPINVIDHIDRNKINNLISNLEDSLIEDNANNIGANSNSASHFRGVHFRTKDTKWHVKVKAKGKTIAYGYFKDEIEAAIKANEALIENFGHTKNLRLNDISMKYTNKEYPNKPRGWVPEKEAA